MTFVRAWLIPLAALPVVWAWWQWRTGRLTRNQRIGLALKALSLVAIALALCEPKLDVTETKTAVAVLVDTSASVGASGLANASDYANKLEAARGRNWMRVVPFARGTRPAAAAELDGKWKLASTGGDAGKGTDLEAAIREAGAALPESLLPRIVLISDGKENQGSIARAAWQAKELGIPIDTYILPGREKPVLHLEAATMPSLVFTGERFAIELAVSSPRRAEGTIEVVADGKTLGASPVTLNAGVNNIRAQAAMDVTGALAVSAVVKTGDLGEVRYTRAVTLRRPRLLYVSQDPAGTEVNFMRAVEAAKFDVKTGADSLDGPLRDLQLVVLNNIDLESMAPARKVALEAFVKNGGGLLVIGGERNLYVEKKPFTPEDPLERTLPARLAPPRSPEGTCLVIVMDKSSSMEGRKMELARLAAIGVIENLRPVDLIGVLIFDNSFQWAVPIRKAEDRVLIKRLVAGVTPDGGTQIAPALSEAYRRIVPAKATFRHIVLLTDGISEEGDSISLAREANEQKVTISTVGLGQDVNRAYLEKIATLSKGRSYFLNDPSGLEQILLRDVMEHTGSTAVEKAITPIVTKNAEILDGVGIESAPALKGYVRFVSKPSAELILAVPGQTFDQRDPLLTRWQFGLGRAAVFASDAKARWADAWIGWKGYGRFWENTLRDLLPHTEAGEATAEFDSATGQVVVDYRLGGNMEEPAQVPGIYISGPDGFQRPVPVAKVAAGAYKGRVHVGARQGLFRVRPVSESRAFPEVGVYREEQEMTETGSNELLLKQVAQFTGGRFNPAPSQVFESAGRAVQSSMRLWPGLVALAIALNIAELILRKWSGLRTPRPA